MNCNPGSKHNAHQYGSIQTKPKRGEIRGIKCFSIHNLDLINYIKINITLAKGCKDLAVSEGHTPLQVVSVY
jgi:hypothetical protein